MLFNPWRIYGFILMMIIVQPVALATDKTSTTPTFTENKTEHPIDPHVGISSNPGAVNEVTGTGAAQTYLCTRQFFIPPLHVMHNQVEAA